MKTAIYRALRTFVQAFAGAVMAQGGFTLTQTDLALLRAGVAAGIAGVLALLMNLEGGS